jgi:hypothetical protein
MLGMILHSTTPEDGEVEKQIRGWFEDNFGREDAEALVEMIWLRERNGARLVDALVVIAKEYKAHEQNSVAEAKAFLGNLLDMARTPAAVREAEMDLLGYARPILERLAARIQGHRGDPIVREESLEEFRALVREKIRSMWPRKHRAAIDGALVVAARAEGGRLVFNARACVKALEMNGDPLEATAASSHG